MTPTIFIQISPASMPLHTTQALASTLPQTSFNSFSIHCPSLDKTPDVQIHHSETCRLPGKVSPPISETQLQISSHNCLTFLLYLSPWISRILHPADDAGSYTFLFCISFNTYLLSEVPLWVHISTFVEICLCVPTKKPDQHANCVPDGHFYTSTLFFQRFLLPLF